MTIIEFYDKDALETMAGALLCAPERVIFVGDNQKQMNRSIDKWKKVLADRNIATELLCRGVNKNNLWDIVELLTELVARFDDCVFDLTGGEDLYLVAVGIVLANSKGAVQCHRFNFRNDTVNDCDADGKVVRAGSFDITVDEQVALYGGEVVRDADREPSTYDWDFNEDFLADIETMWKICCQNGRLWNAQIGTLGSINRHFRMEDSLDISFEREHAARVLKGVGEKAVVVGGMLYELQKHGLIHSLVMHDTVSFTFKNEQVKRCLTVAGQILELVIAGRMATLRDADGVPLYHDIRVGVVIDWDGDEEGDAIRTVNEIDVMAMKGAIPVFISCKNGDFDMEELYKLSTVADRFGGKLVKKVLVSTELDKLGGKAAYLRARMEDMKIRRLENIDELSMAELDRQLKSLWSN